VLLTLDHVTQRFGDLAAVDDLSFAVEEGEIFGIAGPNGAGKTTVFNLISGFYHGSGSIQLDGRRIDGQRPHRVCRQGVARTFQLPVPFASMTVRQNLEIGEHFGHHRSGKASREKTVDEVMSLLELEAVADRPVPTLKLYDKKLTVLGAALATRPRLLLLDEAIAGLSVIEADQTVKLIGRINEELKVTIIMIEHLMTVLTRLCAHLLVMNNGAALKLGSPAEVMDDAEVQEVLLGSRRA